MVMLWGMLPFALSQAVSSSVKDTGDTVLPMFSGFLAVGVNFCLNYILIFGHFGFPRLGIFGAALATVVSRFTELIYISAGVLRRREKYPFIHGVFRNFHIPLDLLGQILVKGMPLVVNEVLWSAGIAAIAQCYSTRGLNAVAAYNIHSTINNLFMILSIGMGSAISILVGQQLGAGNNEKAVVMDRQMIFLSVALCAVGGSFMVLTSSFFPSLYNTSQEVRDLAASLIRIGGFMQPVAALYNSAYFTLRSGGKTIVTFLFDSVFTCVVSLGIAFVLSHYTDLSLTMMFLCVSMADLFKAMLGMYLVEKGVWINNLV
jgi:putative MATE family efflux protein